MTQGFVNGTTANQSVNRLVQGRLTLTSMTPITTTDVTAATTLYFTPYQGNQIALYTGAQWQNITFSEISIAVPASTSQMYDIWCYLSSGVATLELLAWTNDTTRATALATQDGILIKSGDATRRYLGSFRTTGSSGQTEDSLVKRYLWNYYNRSLRPMLATDTTDSWNYSTASYRQSNGSTANQLDCVIGVSEDIVNVQAVGIMSTSTTTTRQGGTGIGINSTTVDSSQIKNAQGTNTNIGAAQQTSYYSNYLAVGRNFIAWLERGAGTDTQTWYGDNGVVVRQTGITGTLLA